VAEAVELVAEAAAAAEAVEAALVAEAVELVAVEAAAEAGEEAVVGVEEAVVAVEAREDWLAAPWTASSRWTAARSKRGWAGSTRRASQKAQGLRRQPPAEEGRAKRPTEPAGGEKADAA
jgi:hypothetical protein